MSYLLALCAFWLAVPVYGQAKSKVDVPKNYPPFMGRSLRDGVDTSVSPCTDFDRFVNGRWRDSTVLPEKVENYDVFVSTDLESHKFLAKLLDSVRGVAATTSDPEAKVVGTYYESCMALDTLGRELSRTSMAGAESYDTSRASRCRRLVMKDLQDALGHVFVRAIIPPASEQRVQTMIANIRQAATDRILRQAWLEKSARERTRDMLGTLTFRVAKPLASVDYRGLALVSNDFHANQTNIRNFLWQHSISSIGNDSRPVWGMTQYTVNAAFIPVQNAIEVPSIMFQWPLYNATGEDAIGYAGVGMVIGHEMYHAITSYSGSEQNEQYKARISRLVEQYTATKVLAQRINGTLTLNENLADLGGLLAAYDAWDKYARKKAVRTIDGFSPEQRFFVHYARLWRAKPTKKYVGAQAFSDPHAPAMARINGVVRNVPAFAKAFGCREGDAMALSDRVEIW